jgi:hypothetical protein
MSASISNSWRTKRGFADKRLYMIEVTSYRGSNTEISLRVYVGLVESEEVGCT